MQLNSQQESAVSHYGSPLVIIAGAGTGKTSVIISKINHLINTNKHRPQDILALTFTNKAAKEMKDRFEASNDCTETPLFGTFHSFCLRFLKQTSKLAEVGLSNNFTIIDPQQQKEIITALQKNNHSIGRKPKDTLSKISKIKQHPYHMYSELVGEAATDIQAIFEPYNTKLKERNCMDFDDLLRYTYQILATHPDELSNLQNRYQYIIVDEYQDTNQIQNDITLLIAKAHQNICVVGDFDQTIYSWRGAKIENLMTFNHHFPNTTVQKLEINYRSTKQILSAANQLIEYNSNRQPKSLISDRIGHLGPQKIVCFDEREEAEFIAKKIKELQQKNQYELKDFAILYRTNQQSRALEETLIYHQIPHKIIGTTSFYQRQEVKVALAYLHCLNNINQPVWFEKAMLFPSRGVGKTTLQNLIEFSISKNISISDAIKDPECPIQKRFVGIIETFIETITNIKNNHTTIEDQFSHLLEEVNIDSFLTKLDNILDRKDNIKELKSKLKDVTNLADFLDDVTLFQGSEDSKNDGQVNCLTLHLAKGLEFPVVFIAGFEDGLLPLKNAESLEEERRLAYVGITRGKDQVYLTSSYKRTLLGEDWYHNPSPFTNELNGQIDVKCTDRAFFMGKALIFKLESANITFKVLKPTPITTATKKPTIHAETVIQSFNIGDVVSHPTLGTGTVEAVSGSNDSTMIDIRFSSGRKKLMAKFAKLKAI